MLAIDTNVLVYAHRREAGEHAKAREIVRQLAEGSEAFAIPWPCIYEFHSVVTNARIWKDAATSPAQSWAQLAAWHASPSARLIGETDECFALLERFLTRPRVRGPVVHDARVAAICMAHGVDALLSRDRDFSLFPELRVTNPFA